MALGLPIRSPPQRAPHPPMREPVGDAELVERARAGDRGAFDELVRRHFAHVHATVRRLIRRHEDAEDLAQETFVRAYRALSGVTDGASFGPWVRRIGVRLALSRRQRAGARATHVELDQDELAERRSLEPAAESDHAELRDALAAALDRLPDRLRAAIVLRTLEEREYEDVARLLDVQPATARTHVAQARRLLVRWLQPWLDQERMR